MRVDVLPCKCTEKQKNKQTIPCIDMYCDSCDKNLLVIRQEMVHGVLRGAVEPCECTEEQKDVGYTNVHLRCGLCGSDKVGDFTIKAGDPDNVGWSTFPCPGCQGEIERLRQEVSTLKAEDIKPPPVSENVEFTMGSFESFEKEKD